MLQVFARGAVSDEWLRNHLGDAEPASSTPAGPPGLNPEPLKTLTRPAAAPEAKQACTPRRGLGLLEW
jgi:hypothetical protein